MNHLICDHLLRAQDRMKKQADKHRYEREFKVGPMVYLKLKPYVQSSVLPRSNHKLILSTLAPSKYWQELALWHIDFNFRPILLFTPSFMCHGLRLLLDSPRRLRLLLDSLRRSALLCLLTQCSIVYLSRCLFLIWCTMADPRSHK
jgi:hypothetical protein